MLQSKLFTKTRREDPKDEIAKNAKLLVRAGFIHKESAGVYAFLPLGLRVLNKIEKIIREEMNELGGQEVSLTALQNPEEWKKSGRWEDTAMDNWFKTKLKDGGELGLGVTHEEPLTNLLRNHINSYRDLPVFVYQLQTKFRNEERAKSGLLRGREFLMKDLYSFHSTQTDFESFYERAKEAYLKIYQRIGLGDITFITFASGGSFSKYSHEFQTLCETGEDTIYLSREKRMAVNKEVYTDEVLADLKLDKDSLEEIKAIEVGNIFPLGTRFSESLELNYLTEDGEKKLVVMGSYGIGLSRLMGTVVEALSDDRGIVWPTAIAPLDIHLVVIGYQDESVRVATDDLVRKLESKGLEVLIDDRDVSAGEKFSDADLIGIPVRLVISPKTVEEKIIEMKDRRTGEVRKLSESDLLKNFS
jgi:prolyl-tRNA synthetase